MADRAPGRPGWGRSRGLTPRRLSTLRGLTSLLGTLVLVLLGAVAPTRAAAETPVVEKVLTMAGTPEADGRPVFIDVSLFTTDPASPRPAVVLAHGFGGTKADSASTARLLARDGYAVITYTARGFGRSGGMIHLDDPAFEGADARKLIDLAAHRPEVEHTGNDPVIGFAGGSYGGALSLLVAGLDPRVDAIAPAFTWSSLSTALFPQYATATAARSLAGVNPVAATGVFKQRWASLFFLGGGAAAGGGAAGPAAGSAQLCGRFTPALCRGYLETAQTGVPSPALVTLLRRSDLGGVLPRVTAPTLLVNGEQDTLFPLDQADANLRGLPASTPAKMEWVEGGHDAGIDIDALVPDLESWFGRYLKHDQSPADTSFRATVPQTSLIGTAGADAEPETVTAPAYPGRGAALQTRSLPLSGERQSLVSPPGGTPAALTNLPGTGGALAQLSSVGGYALGVLGGQSATFTTAPLTQPLTLLGSGSVALQVSSSTSAATLFASVWDLGPDLTSGAGAAARTAPGTAVLPGLAVSPVRLSGLTPGRSRTVRVALPPVAAQVPVGHRLRLVVSSTDQAYAVPRDTAVYSVALAPGSDALVLPRLDATVVGASRLDVPLALVVVVAALLLAALAAVVVLWLRRRSDRPRSELAGTPLVVEGLVKTYKDGFKAVDGVSFSAAAGQVVGLLGPNGAGKTTTMRMLVGLIRPDAGTVWVAGQPVHAGADVLGSVGAFIEGPGFLPHLTGMENLHAFWAATGRPPEDARLDEALQIAGLGSALDRRVRTYSQGMRQRLGIAQAMLGLPTLLLLDEPTNGLDPPQIKAMRAVLADYAAAGRTVVVSSHLLSEVEQTCSHVVVMNKGRVILTGSMAELTASDDVTLIGLSDPGRLGDAGRELTDLGVDVVTEGELLRVTGTRPRSELVAQLVSAGHGIESVDGRRQLEEVFMNLVGTPAQDAENPQDQDAEDAGA